MHPWGEKGQAGQVLPLLLLAASALTLGDGMRAVGGFYMELGTMRRL